MTLDKSLTTLEYSTFCGNDKVQQKTKMKMSDAIECLTDGIAIVDPSGRAYKRQGGRFYYSDHPGSPLFWSSTEHIRFADGEWEVIDLWEAQRRYELKHDIYHLLNKELTSTDLQEVLATIRKFTQVEIVYENPHKNIWMQLLGREKSKKDGESLKVGDTVRHVELGEGTILDEGYYDTDNRIRYWHVRYRSYARGYATMELLRKITK